MLLVALVLLPGLAAAQELVVNPGMEAYSRCPTGPGLIDGWVDDWWRASVASTDFQHTCDYSPQPPRSGEGHLGFLAYDFSPNYREYATGRLLAPLVAGRDYRLELWVLLHENYLHAVAEVGAYFSATRPSWPGTLPPAGITPQVVNATGVLSDKLSWMLVSERFVADGGEEWVTIGNFSDDASSTIFDFGCCGQFGAYYHLDDVSLVLVNEPPTCLYRSDLSSLTPFTPPRDSVFMPATPEGVSLRTGPYQCPIADGDLEREALVLRNGVPLSFYQVGLVTGALRLLKTGADIRFRF